MYVMMDETAPRSEFELFALYTTIGSVASVRPTMRECSGTDLRPFLSQAAILYLRTNQVNVPTRPSPIAFNARLQAERVKAIITLINRGILSQ